MKDDDWIPVDQALPLPARFRILGVPDTVFIDTASPYVLAWLREGRNEWPSLAVYCRGRGRFEAGSDIDVPLPVTHWMPIPHGPRREGEWKWVPKTHE